MTVGELKEKLKDLDDNLEVISEDSLEEPSLNTNVSIVKIDGYDELIFDIEENSHEDMGLETPEQWEEVKKTARKVFVISCF